MAKTISDEVMKLSIMIDGDQAKNELFKLEKATRLLTEENKALSLQKKLLEKQGKQETEQYKLLSAVIKQNTAEINSNKNKMKDLQEQIGITGLTISQLTQKAFLLRMQLRNVVPGSADYNRYQQELKQVTSRLDELRLKAQTAKFSLSSIADSFNRYQALAVSVVATLTGVVFSIQKMIDYNGKLSDAQANVMKTTKMTKQEVDELGKSFGLLETRTSRINLYKIAEQGGRLGIPKEEIADFVRNMDVAAVALGDSFTGGVDQVAEKLGKIKFLFKETKDLGIDSAYASIGSAINELGADGVASEANIAEFTTRVGSLPGALKPAVQEALALGAAFEESGIEAEVSSRAYNIFMKQASTEASKFAQVMGISKKAVEDMINTNPLNFMLEFSKGLKGMDATEIAKTLDFLGVNADGANKVVATMGDNYERFVELIDLSNTSFAEGTSMLNEFNVKNETLQATLEKIGKRVAELFSSVGFTNWLAGLVSWFAKLIGATADADGKMEGFRNRLIFLIKVLAIVITSYVSYNAALRLTALWTQTLSSLTTILNAIQNRGAVATGLLRSAQLLLASAYYAVTGNTSRATAAMRLFNATSASNPIGLVVAAVLGLVVALKLFSKTNQEVSKVQKTLNDVHAEATKEIAKEKNELNLLARIARDERISKEKRLEAIKKLNEIIPDYIGTLTLENIKNQEGIDILKKYTAELYNNARAKAVQSKFDELAKTKVDLESKDSSQFEDNSIGGSLASFFGQEGMAFKNRQELDQYILKTFAKQLNVRKDERTGLIKFNKQLFEKLVKDYLVTSKLDIKEREIADVDLQMKALEDELLKNTIKGEDKDDKNSTVISNYNVPGETGTSSAAKNPNSSAAEIAKLRLENERKFADEYLKIQRQIEDDAIAIMEDGYEKENAIEALRYKRELEDLSRTKVNKEELARLDEEISKAKEAKDMTKYNALLEIKKYWSERNIQIDEKMQELTEGKFTIHQKKLAIIQEKGAKAQIEKEKEAFDRAKILRETKFQEQLAALGNNEKAKEKLTKEFNKNELEIEEKFLNELIQKLNDIIKTGKYEKIDLDLLSPEQVDEMTKLAEKAGLALQELINKKNALIGEKTNAEALGVSDGSTDILGFTAENWDQFFSNLEKGKFGIDEMVFAVSALTQMYSQYNSFVTANENAQLRNNQRSNDLKKRRLKQQLDSGMINQRQYKDGIEKLDQDLEKKKADLSYKQAKREKMIAVMSAISGTAMAVIGALGNKPWTPANFVLASIVGAMGALNLATILATPLPSRGAEKGLYNPEYIKRSQDGKVFKNTGTTSMKTGAFSKPTLLVGEGPGDMPEMVIDKRSFARISPSVKEALIRELNGVRGFENGYYDNLGRYTVPVANEPKPTNNNNDDLILMLMGVVKENTETMRDLRENGVIGKFFRDDKRSMKEIEQGIKEYLELKDKAKQ